MPPVVRGDGWPPNIPQIVVFADIDISLGDEATTASLDVRLIDPEDTYKAGSGVKKGETAFDAFSVHGFVALITALPPTLPSWAEYTAELEMNGEPIHGKR